MNAKYFSGETFATHKKTETDIIAEIAASDRSHYGSAANGFTYSVVESAPTLKIERKHVPTNPKLGKRAQLHLITVVSA